jgi:hypothetical protein
MDATNGTNGAVSIGAYLRARVEGTQGYPKLNAAVYGYDQTDIVYPTTSVGFGGYFNRLMAVGLYISCIRLYDANNNYVLKEGDVFISCKNASTLYINLPRPQCEGKIYFVRINNSATVNINGYDYSFGAQIMTENSSLVNSVNASTRGELITLLWDGLNWLYSTTAS